MIYSISYPRSGITWFRYCIEFITSKPTQGNERDMPIASRDGIETLSHVSLCDEKAFYKRHCYYDVYDPNKDKLILVVRNPVENFSREYSKENKDVDHIIKKSIPKFINNLEGVDSFKKSGGEVLVIYYEDLISNDSLQIVINQCVSFFPSAEKDLSIKLMRDIDYHRKSSVKNYPQSYTKGKKGVKHQKHVSDQEIDTIKTSLKEQIDESLYRKYLKRYDI